MALGTFQLTIDGGRIGGGAETTARVQVQRQGPDFILDPDGNRIYFAHESARSPISVSLPYTVDLETDVATGSSSEVGYTVTVLTAFGGPLTATFAAQASGQSINFADLVTEIVVPLVPDAVTTSNFDTMLQAELEDPASEGSLALADTWVAK